MSASGGLGRGTCVCQIELRDSPFAQWTRSLVLGARMGPTRLRLGSGWTIATRIRAATVRRRCAGLRGTRMVVKHAGICSSFDRQCRRREGAVRTAVSTPGALSGGLAGRVPDHASCVAQACRFHSPVRKEEQTRTERQFMHCVPLPPGRLIFVL